MYLIEVNEITNLGPHAIAGVRAASETNYISKDAILVQAQSLKFHSCQRAYLVYTVYG